MFKSSKLLILDLDETLIHYCCEWIGRPPNFLAANQIIFTRPFTDEFLNYAFHHFDIAVWSAASGKYFVEVMDVLIPSFHEIIFAWDREKCIPFKNGNKIEFYKDLDQIRDLGYKTNNVYIIDDKPENYINISQENLIPAQPYWGDSSDAALFDIILALKAQKG